MTEKAFSSKFPARVASRIAGNARRIAMVCFAVAVASSVYTLTRTPRWGAWAAVIVPGSTATSLSSTAGALGLGDAVGTMGVLGSGMFSGMGGVDLTLAVQILGSRRISERIILEYDLINRYRTVSMERALTKFSQRSSVDVSPDGVIFVTAQGESRTEATAMVNDMIRFANDELNSLVTSRSRRGRLETERALSLAEDSLEAARASMQEFRVRTGLVFPDQQAAGMVDAMAEIQGQLITAGALLEGISGTLSPRSALYAQARAQYDYLENALLSGPEGAGAMGIFPSMDSIPNYLREYETLLIELETRIEIYLLLRSELETLKIEESKDSPTLEIIVPPVPEYLRAYPKRAVTVITHTLLAAFLCILWLCFITWFQGVLAGPDTGPFIRETTAVFREQFRLRRKSSGKK